jgi:ATP-dependent exoDNAse (exonuclease V) alpha subunit
VEAVAARAAHPVNSISLAAPALLSEPDRLRRGDGESVFVPHASTRYTSRAVLDAEEHLLDAARTPATDPTGTATPVPAAATVTAVLDGFEAVTGTQLDPGQRALVTAFVTDPRRIVVGIGAAGTGKTTAMRAYLHALTNTTPPSHSRPARPTQPRLIPLATSAVAAAILGQNLGVPAENLHKFLYEHRRGAFADRLYDRWRTQELPSNLRQFALNPGDVILVDEAGMAGTRNLDRLLAIAVHHGARIRLLGDYRQLAAVESGGALRLLATDVGAVGLSTLHRFRDPAEAAATLKLRVGDSSGLDFYTEHHRILGGSTSAMTEAAYTGWLTDMRAGLTTFMPSATNTDVVALSARARLDRVQVGQVEAAGVQLHDGNHAGAGDWIVTRRNNRRLSMHNRRHWVRNGDPWRVLHRHDDGSLDVQHLGHGGRIRLPADYVAAQVELLYATTVHRVQGGTVDTAHPLVTDAMTREHLYVAAARASQRTTLYVATHNVLPLDDDERLDATGHDPDARAAREVLQDIIGREGAERSATETIRDLQNAETSLATLIPRYLHADTKAAAQRHQDALHQVFDEDIADALIANSAWPELTRALRRGEHTTGWTAEELLTQARYRRPDPFEADVATGSDRATERWQAITGRMAVAVDALTTEPPTTPLTRPTRGQAARYAQLVATITDREAPAFPLDLGNNPPERLTTRQTPRTAGSSTAMTGTSPPSRSGGVPDRHAFGQAIGQALGSKLANRALRESAWPALQLALQRADAAGYNVVDLLRQHTNRRDLTRTMSVSEALAWRIQRHITLRSPSTPDATNPNTSAGAATGQATSTGNQPSPGGMQADVWRTLAWRLASHERTGRDLAELLPGSSAPGDETAPVSLADVVRHVQQRVEHLENSAIPMPLTPDLPPWVPPPPADDDYLSAAADAIRARIESLARDLVRERPAWAGALGEPPADPAAGRAWRRHAGIAAAYREHHQITDDDPAHPLGPYIEPDQHGHHDYWHAAEAIVQAHQLGNADQHPRQSFEGDPVDGQPGGRPPPTRDADRTAAIHEAVAHQVATDTYQALPDAERIAVAAGVVARLGNLWFGPEHGADEAVTHRVYAGQLRASLTERGHLADTTGDPSARHSDRTQAVAAGRPARRPGGKPSRDRTPHQQPRSPSTRPAVTKEPRQQSAPQPPHAPTAARGSHPPAQTSTLTSRN